MERERKGRDIAAARGVRLAGDMWLVPSTSSTDTTYRVVPEGAGYRCSCPDFEMRRCKCKHIYAVEFTVAREVTRLIRTEPNGKTTVTTTVKEVKTARVTYKQNWPAYNAAQTHETERFLELLHGLCDGIVQPPQGRGRPRLPLSDVVFAAVVKVYSTVSGRRAMSDLRACQERGYLSRLPCYNSVFNYLDDPALTPILKALVEEAASPLKAVETDFAVDSSGFTSSRFVRWFDHKWGKMHTEREWVKAHLMIGVKTNIVTSVEVTPGTAHDSPYLRPLVATTAKRFAVAEVSADKAYSGAKNLAAVLGLGATPYVPFKSNVTGQGAAFWRKLYHYYEFQRDDFLAHYHKRSNVESTFMMLKAKFGDGVRAKTPVGQMNEVLCKVLAHNLCVLIASIYELGIEPTFWAESTVAQKVGA